MNGGAHIQRSGERFADVGGLSLCYESFGDPTDETVLAGIERTAKRAAHRL